MTKPVRPQFRDADGSWDWAQMADLFIPGNVWDSRANRIRPQGVAHGIATTFTGPLTGRVAGLALEATPDSWWRNPFGGGGTVRARPSEWNATAGMPLINARPSEWNATAGQPLVNTPPSQWGPPAPGQGGGQQSRSQGALLGAGQRFGSLMDFMDMYEAQHRRAQQER